MKILKALTFLVIIFTATAFAQQQNTHVVKQGETLYSISKSLGVTVAELRAWNDLEANALSIGQELIYYAQHGAVRDTVASEPGPSLVNVTNKQENTFYTVKAGDNLTVIARAHGMSVRELKELNNLESDLISIGQRLTVRKIVNSVAPSASEFSEESAPQGSFAVYTIKSGDTGNKIAEQFLMTARELGELNPDVNMDQLDRGQKITVLLPPSRSFSNPYRTKANLQNLGSVQATVYSESELGNTTTNGELYNPGSLSAAHSNIALGSVIFVENPVNQQGFYIRINDRITGNGLKLSARAYRILGLGNDPNPVVTIYTES